jgi:hypothetical protein
MSAVDPGVPVTSRAAAPASPSRVRRADETKPAFKTTEFIAYVAILVGVFVAGLVIKGGDTDEFKAPVVWLYAVILTFGYLVSRGIAKSGSRHRYDDDRF